MKYAKPSLWSIAFRMQIITNLYALKRFGEILTFYEYMFDLYTLIGLNVSDFWNLKWWKKENVGCGASKLRHRVIQISPKDGGRGNILRNPTFFRSSAGKSEKKKISGAIFWNIEVSFDGGFLTLFATQALGHYATCQGSSYTKNEYNLLAGFRRKPSYQSWSRKIDVFVYLFIYLCTHLVDAVRSFDAKIVKLGWYILWPCKMGEFEGGTC